MEDKQDSPWHPYPQAPSIEDLLARSRRVLNSTTMLSALAGAGIAAPPAAGFVRNMMRLLVRSCEEYKAAIQYHTVAVEAGSPVTLLHASSHWEGCIEALHRCINIAEEFRCRLHQWAPNDRLMRIDRKAKIRDSDRVMVRGMRDAIQHMDEALQEQSPPGSDARGGGYFVYCGADAIIFRGNEVRYGDIVRLLEHLLDLSMWMKMQNPPPGHPLADPTREQEIKHVGSEQFRKPFGA